MNSPTFYRKDVLMNPRMERDEIAEMDARVNRVYADYKCEGGDFMPEEILERVAECKDATETGYSVSGESCNCSPCLSRKRRTEGSNPSALTNLNGGQNVNTTGRTDSLITHVATIDRKLDSERVAVTEPCAPEISSPSPRNNNRRTDGEPSPQVCPPSFLKEVNV